MQKISQKIIDYSIWYYLKYYPSPRKLAFKLNQKFGQNSEKGKKYGGINREEIDFIINIKLKNILQEKEVIKSKIRSYKSKGKSKLYIKQKLYGRMENTDLIKKYLEKAFIDGELDLIKKEYDKIKKILFLRKDFEITSKSQLKKQKIIEKLLRKGFSYGDIIKVVI